MGRRMWACVGLIINYVARHPGPPKWVTDALLPQTQHLAGIKGEAQRADMVY